MDYRLRVESKGRAMGKSIFTFVLAYVLIVLVLPMAFAEGPRRLRPEDQLSGGPPQRYGVEPKLLTIEGALAPRPEGVRISRGGEIYYVNPGASSARQPVAYESHGMTRMVRIQPQPRARFRTTIVHDPDAFRPVE
jgi:hypothetical protein